MRYIFGTLALLAAIVIVGYSATTLFTSAYTASSEPWQQYLNGTGAAAIVLWEATALILIGAAWHRGYKPVAVLSSLLLIVAMAVTLTWEMRTVIGGRADAFASREVDARKQRDISADLDWLRKRRETLTTKPSSVAVRKEMDWIASRIEGLEKDRTSARAVKEVMPEAAWASRMMGGSEQLWNDILSALPLLFWMLARVAAAPLAVAAMVGRRKEDIAPRTAAKDKTPVTVALTPASPVSAPAKPSPELAKLFQAPETDPKPPASQPLPEPKPVEAEIKPALRLVETQPEPVRPKTRAEREEAIDATTREWVAACAIPTPVGFATPSAQAYASYRAWCRTHKVEPLNRSWFGRSLARIGITVRKSAQGANYGLQITSEVGRRAAAG
jgi:outer membrane biosynthesis protein TonB